MQIGEVRMSIREPLWQSDAAIAATGGNSNMRWTASGVSIDSRTVEPGDLFVAIRGPAQDGHKFVKDALANGAVCALVDHIPEDVPADAPLLIVADTLAGLNALAVAARQRVDARIIAVTGSVGKTGTKEMLRAAFGAVGKTHASVASYNNLWGVPLSLARMPADTQFGIFEIGMNHAGEIAPLSRLVQPDVAIITAIAAAHIGHFASVTEIAEAKAEIFAGLKSDGVALINRDSEFFDLLAARAGGKTRMIRSFGSHAQADIRLQKAVPHSHCTCVAATILGQAATYKIGLVGRHWAMNSLAVMGAIAACDQDLALASLALGNLASLAGRGMRHQLQLATGEFTLFDDSYNANPASMRAAIENLAHQSPEKSGRRIAVIGDMAELGTHSQDYHLELANIMQQQKIDLIFAAGPEMAAMYAALPKRMQGAHKSDAAELAKPVIDGLRPGDIVMVKGSLSSGMSRVVAALLTFSETGQVAAPRGIEDAV